MTRKCLSDSFPDPTVLEPLVRRSHQVHACEGVKPYRSSHNGNNRRIHDIRRGRFRRDAQKQRER